MRWTKQNPYSVIEWFVKPQRPHGHILTSSCHTGRSLLSVFQLLTRSMTSQHVTRFCLTRLLFLMFYMCLYFLLAFFFMSIPPVMNASEHQHVFSVKILRAI